MANGRAGCPTGWPLYDGSDLYLWYEQDRWGCDSNLLVIATSIAVSAWAREPIRMGASVTQVIALGPLEIPRITDVAEACADPPLAVLSAAMHAGQPDGQAVAWAALAAARCLPRGDAWFYTDLVFHVLKGSRASHGGPMFDPRVLQEKTDWPGWEWYKAVVKQGIAQGSAEEAIRSRAEILLRQRAGRGFTVTPAMRARVSGCRDAAKLDEWLDRVLVARSAAEAFKS